MTRAADLSLSECCSCCRWPCSMAVAVAVAVTQRWRALRLRCASTAARSCWQPITVSVVHGHANVAGVASSCGSSGADSMINRGTGTWASNLGLVIQSRCEDGQGQCSCTGT